MGYVFGYGSLVNCDTHDYEPVATTRLYGWRRHWCHWIDRPERQAVSLTVSPCPGAWVDGLLARLTVAQWDGLDEREAGYDRVVLDDTILPKTAQRLPVVTYQSRTFRTGSADHPIYQSYLDTVLLGFLRAFGDKGIAQFLTETDGWETPILRDRAAPGYPRAVALPNDVRQRVDQSLQDFGVTYLDP